MGESIQTIATIAPAEIRKTLQLSPNQRLLLKRAIALIICASICLMALGLVPRHAPAPPAGHAVAAPAPIA